MKEYEDLLKDGKAGCLSDLPITELEQYSGENQVDKTFFKFKERISTNKDQIIRYERGGEPLWINSKYQLPKEEIPNCESCGEKRDFEFQVCKILSWVLEFCFNIFFFVFYRSCHNYLINYIMIHLIGELLQFILVQMIVTLVKNIFKNMHINRI